MSAADQQQANREVDSLTKARLVTLVPKWHAGAAQANKEVLWLRQHMPASDGAASAAEVPAAPAYLRQMPEPERVIADMHGSDKLDTAARQVAALNRLIDVNIGLSGHADDPGGPQLTPEERSLNGRYAAAASSIYTGVYRSLDPDNKQQSAENSSRNRWNRLRDRYYNDDAFIGALLQRYLTPDSKEQYLGQLGQTRRKNSGDAPTHAGGR